MSLLGDIWAKVHLTPRSDRNVNLTQSLILGDMSDQKSDQMSTWPEASSWCTSDQRSSWPNVWPNVNLTQSLILGGMSDQKSAWPKVWPNVNWPKASSSGVYLTKGQPDSKSDKLSTWPEASSWGAYLTNGQPNQRSDKNVNQTQTLTYRGSTWLSAERLSENSNTFCILGVASQRFFSTKDLRKQLMTCYKENVFIFQGHFEVFL